MLEASGGEEKWCACVRIGVRVYMHTAHIYIHAYIHIHTACIDIHIEEGRKI